MAKTCLRPEHFGERLVHRLLETMVREGRLNEIRCHRRGEDTPISLSELLTKLGVEGTLNVQHDVPLAPLITEISTFRLDGAQKLDGLISNGAKGIAIEVKLGRKGLTAKSMLRHLKDCCASTHKDRRIKGNIIALLDGRFAGLPQPPIPFKSEGGVTLASQWLLVVRESVYESWRRTGWPQMRHAHVIIFEDLAQLIGGARQFDDMVKELIGGDFAEAWEISWPKA
jgi:hypothetical protein